MIYFCNQSLYTDQSCSTIRNQQDSPLLRLPGELRNRIYEYALGDFQIFFKDRSVGRGVEVYTTNEEADKRMIRAPHFQGLTTTCRQVHAETKLLPFALNEFTGDIFDVKPFLIANVHHTTWLSAIKTLQLKVYGLTGYRTYPISILKILCLVQQLNGLKKVIVEHMVFKGWPSRWETHLAAEVEGVFRQRALNGDLEVLVKTIHT